MKDLDLSRPSTPDEFLRWSTEELEEYGGPSWLVTELDTMWSAVLQELQDITFTGQLHHNSGTYERGCRGPLCRKAYRENPKRKTPAAELQRSPRMLRRLDPILEYYHTVGKHRLNVYKLELLGLIKVG